MTPTVNLCQVFRWQHCKLRFASHFRRFFVFRTLAMPGEFEFDCRTNNSLEMGLQHMRCDQWLIVYANKQLLLFFSHFFSFRLFCSSQMSAKKIAEPKLCTFTTNEVKPIVGPIRKFIAFHTSTLIGQWRLEMHSVCRLSRGDYQTHTHTPLRERFKIGFNSIFQQKKSFFSVRPRTNPAATKKFMIITFTCLLQASRCVRKREVHCRSWKSDYPTALED